MHWWQPLPLGKGCLIGDLQAAVALASQASQELGQSLQEPQDYSKCRWQELQANSSQCSVGCKWPNQVNQVRWQELTEWQTLSREVRISQIVWATSSPELEIFSYSPRLWLRKQFFEVKSHFRLINTRECGVSLNNRNCSHLLPLSQTSVLTTLCPIYCGY